MSRLAVVSAVCLLLAASVTLQGCGDNAESTTPPLRGVDKNTTVPDTAATPGSKKTSAKDVPNEATKDNKGNIKLKQALETAAKQCVLQCGTQADINEIAKSCMPAAQATKDVTAAKQCVLEQIVDQYKKGFVDCNCFDKNTQVAVSR